MNKFEKIKELQLELKLLGCNNFDITYQINGVYERLISNSPMIIYIEEKNYKKLSILHFDNLKHLPSTIWKMRLTHLTINAYQIKHIPQKQFNNAKNLLYLDIIDTSIYDLPLFYNKRRLKYIKLPREHKYIKLPKCLKKMIKYGTIKIITTLPYHQTLVERFERFPIRLPFKINSYYDSLDGTVGKATAGQFTAWMECLQSMDKGVKIYAM